MAETRTARTGKTGDGAVGSMPERSLLGARVPYDVLQYVPLESATHYGVVPLSVTDGVLEVGFVDPDNLSAIDALNFISRKTGMPFKSFHISDADFKNVLGMYQGMHGEIDEAVSDFRTEEDEKQRTTLPSESEQDINLTATNEAQSDKLDEMAGLREDAPTIKLVTTILRYAIDGGASDVHIEPVSAGVRVRYRVDGVLRTSVVLPAETHRALVARVKVLSSIRLDEHRKPQDGRFSATIEGRRVDFRVSTFPVYNGEKIVIRILDREEGVLSLEKLGISPRNIALIREAIKQPHGLVLISGPTGSGKSTTLYAMLAEVDREQKNVLSLEDPVEYYMEGVSQSQVRPEIGYTFATGLRSTLRQDPDVILVGEIRDGETAQLAIQAALTGHLVLSTIHTNSAVGTIPRLIDMGVEPYLIPPVLILSLAQRLVRTLCPDAGKPFPVTPSIRSMFEESFATLPAELRPTIKDTLYEAQRTPTCPSGLRGRMAVMEAMEMRPNIEQIILQSPIESKIWEAARKNGMLTMQEDALLKAFEGTVPYSEVTALGSLSVDDEDSRKQEDGVKTTENAGEPGPEPELSAPLSL